jgi:hypothetical protein
MSKWPEALESIISNLVICAIIVTLTISVSSCLAKVSDNNTRCETAK